MRRLIAFSVALLLGLPSAVVAQERPGTPLAKRSVAPLMLLYGNRDATKSVEQAMRDVARRDGGAFVDLSPAPLPPPSAPVELRHAVAAYQEFDYGRAMKHLAAAMTEIESGGVRGLSSAELSDLFIYRALVRNAQGDSSAAWEDFVQAATIDPTRHLDAVRYSPSVAASFERARKEVASRSAVSLQVDIASSCTLEVDARKRGPETAVSVRPGTHFLHVDCPGYNSYSDAILLDQDQTLRPTLKKIAGPSSDELATMAKDRGFRHIVFALISKSTDSGTAVYSLLKRDGTELARTSMMLTGKADDRAMAVASISRLLDALKPVVSEPLIVVQERSWYERPWLWATAGVAVTAAILLPFALRDDQGTGFRIELGGATP